MSRHATSRRRLVSPRLATPRHALPRLATPRLATASPHHASPLQLSSAHAATAPRTTGFPKRLATIHPPFHTACDAFPEAIQQLDHLSTSPCRDTAFRCPCPWRRRRTHTPTQVVQILLLASTRAFVGTVTSNFGQLVTKLMGFATPAPVALDLSCVGLTSMRNGSSGIVWAPGWAEGDEARCRRASRSPRNLRVIS